MGSGSRMGSREMQRPNLAMISAWSKQRTEILQKSHVERAPHNHAAYSDQGALVFNLDCAHDLTDHEKEFEVQELFKTAIKMISNTC